MDGVLSFQHLVDNADNWHDQVVALTKYAGQRYEEYVEEYKRLLVHARTKSAKSPSIASIHSVDDAGEMYRNLDAAEMSSPRPTELAAYNPLEAGNRFIYAQAHRKRRPGTSIRSNASGPRVFRSKKLMVIYYDSYIQSELDKLVRAYGAARNNLRKGKLTYSAAKGLFLPSISRRQEYSDAVSSLKPPPSLAKQASETSLISTTAPQNGEAAFVQLDKELELVQSLCETAAHQAIRDGDISKELTEAASKLQVISAMARSALEAVQAEKAKLDEEAQVTESRSFSDSTSIHSTLCEKPSVEAFAVPHKTLPPVVEALETKRPLLAATVSAPLLTDAIEVDDDEEDDESMDFDININNYRLATRR